MNPRFLLLLIFTLSGFSGLVYESIWTHYLKLLLGHAAYAQSLVLSIFLGGLAAGSWLSSKFLARIRNPLLAYVLAELFLGVSAFAFHRIFDASSNAFYSLATATGAPIVEFARWSLATTLITPQAIVLGMTFPWMSAALIRFAPASAGASVSLLYFTNSIGGAVGALTSGFLLIGKFGLPGTLMIAGFVNVVICALVRPFTRRPEFIVAFEGRASGQVAHRGHRSTVGLLAVAALTGLASFYYEIAWIRMLGLVLSSSNQSFELMLSAFVTGLALGGLWIRKRIDVIADLVTYLGYVQLLMGLFAVLTLPLYIVGFDVMAGVIQLAPKNGAGYTVHTIVSLLICLAVMLPATFMAGMTLPVLSKLMIDGPHGEKAVGYVYALNTLGGIVGVLTAIHVLIATVGVKYLIVAGALVDMGLACWLLRPDSRRVRLLPIAAALGLAALVVALQRLSPQTLASGVFRHGHSSLIEDTDVRYYEDGKTASVAVTWREPRLTIRTNGKPDGSIDKVPNKMSPDETTMVLLGVLPLVIKPHAAEIANIGFGTGLTTHTLLGSSRVRRIDTIEIEPRMIEGARLFGDVNRRAYEDGRSQIHIDDAKSFFARHNRQYDVIISEPSNPWVTGIANLFSTEFYEHVKPFLREDGIFVQWLQLYEIDLSQVASVIKAIYNNFRYFELYNTYEGDMVIVAGNEPIPEPDPWVFREEPLRFALSKINIHTPYELKIRKFGDQSTMGLVFAREPGPMNSDYFPYLAFSAPKSLFLHVNTHRYLSELRYAPVPILPVLNDLPLQYIETAGRQHHFIFYQRYQVAKDTMELLRRVEELPVPGLQANRFVNDIVAMQNDCGSSPGHIRSLYKLAGRVNPFLPADETVPLWSRLEAACEAENAETKRWIELHKSIAGRDYATMAAASRELIAGGVSRHDKDLWDYLWTSYLLASLELGTGEQVVAFANAQGLAPNAHQTIILLNIFGVRAAGR